MAAGLGGRSSFDELNQAVQRQSEGTTTQPASTKSAETSSNSNSGTLLAIGAGVAVVLLGGVAFVIVRDARRVAPAGDADLIESRARSNAAARVRRRRARAKAARRQRKRNR